MESDTRTMFAASTTTSSALHMSIYMPQVSDGKCCAREGAFTFRRFQGRVDDGTRATPLTLNKNDLTTTISIPQRKRAVGDTYRSRSSGTTILFLARLSDLRRYNSPAFNQFMYALESYFLPKNSVMNSSGSSELPFSKMIFR